MEQVKLDPFLVQAKCNGFEIEVTVDHVARQRTIGSETAGWCVRSRHGVDWYTSAVVIGCCRVQGSSRNGGRQCGRGLGSARGSRGTRVS